MRTAEKERAADPRIALWARLDDFTADLQREAQDTLSVLGPILDEFRSSVPKAEWDNVCLNDLRPHQICSVLLQDPFTRHSFERPRGYPGDAELIDYIYGYKPVNGASTVGAAIHRHAINVQSGVAVRERRQILTERIDAIADEFENPRILALAAGHLREADHSLAIKSRRIGQLIAFDQDAASLATIMSAYGNGQIETQQGSVRSIIAGKHSFKDFHFVYAAGLFDYLSARAAARLVERMFDMLLPGGRLLVANFAPTLKNIGYMEAFMRWYLIYRDEQQMVAMSAGIDSSRIAKQRVYWDSNGCMLFLEVERA